MVSTASDDFGAYERLVVSDPGRLRGICRAIRAAGAFAVDTEFIRERSYRPKLCLVQVAVGDTVSLLDPLALDLAEFWPLVVDPAIVKIAHAGTQDWEMCFHACGKPPANVFDVQVAAGLAGLPYPLSYGKLVRQIFDVEIPQGHSFSDWLRRPLTAQQLEYAAADVTWLTPVYEFLRRRLTELGRLDWMTQEMQPFEGTELYWCEPWQAWRKVRGIGRLSPVELAVLRELAVWRETAAAIADLPARTFLADPAMVALARAKPAAATAVAACRFVPRPLASRHGDDITRAVQAGLATPKDKLPRLPKSPPLDGDKELVHRLAVAGAQHCLANQITPELFAAKHNYSELVRALTDRRKSKHAPHLLAGWRKHLTLEILAYSNTGLAPAAPTDSDHAR